MLDEARACFDDLGDYDHRPARGLADANEKTTVRSTIDVDILGHIPEQATTDLERMGKNLETGACARTLSADNGMPPAAAKNRGLRSVTPVTQELSGPLAWIWPPCGASDWPTNRLDSPRVRRLRLSNTW